MKTLKPVQLLLFASGIIAFVLWSILVSLSFYNHELSNTLIIGVPILIFGTTYLVFYYVLKIFIYQKIKLIYKSIYNLKSPRSHIDKIKLQNNVLSDVEKEVNLWAINKQKEIQKLKKMEIYRREFLGNVSHELKTPIFNIQGYIDTLVYGGVYDDKINIKYLKKALENTKRLSVIVSDLEMISNMESDNLTLNFERFNLVEFIKDILTSFELQSKERNISLVLSDPNSSHFVFADKKRIQQVFVNLIGNSIKYGKEGGTTKISSFDMDTNILIEISDNGIGIEKTHLNRLFERFYRVDSNRSREQGGTGLGLAIVKHIIEVHDQTVNIRSTPGIGSTFGFTLKKG